MVILESKESSFDNTLQIIFLTQHVVVQVPTLSWIRII